MSVPALVVFWSSPIETAYSLLEFSFLNRQSGMYMTVIHVSLANLRCSDSGDRCRGRIQLLCRATDNVMPGPGASTRVPGAGGITSAAAVPRRRGGQVSAQQRSPIHAGWLSPTTWVVAQELFAATTPEAQQLSASPPMPAAMEVYLRARNRD